jgi:probable HAF family extracellular repeat protein
MAGGLLGTATVLILAPHLCAQVMFDTIGPFQNGTYVQVLGLSGDGATAVGSCRTSAGTRPLRWTIAQGSQNLGQFFFTGDGAALDANEDGSIVVGYAATSVGTAGFRWTAATGLQDLGYLAGNPVVWMTAITPSGHFMAGVSAQRAIRRPAAAPHENLGWLPGGFSSVANDISADGSVVVGHSGSSAGLHAFRWTSAAGMVDLGVPPLPGADTSSAAAISADGAVIALNVSGVGGRVVRRTPAGQLDIGVLPDRAHSRAEDMSADGSAIVGRCTGAGQSNKGFLWTQASGMFDVDAYLRSQGAPLGNRVIHSVNAVAPASEGGWIIAGSMAVPSTGQDIGFRATIPASALCNANCDVSTAIPILNVADFTCFLQRFAAGDAYANCDGSAQTPVLNVADFTCFLQRFAAGCP